MKKSEKFISRLFMRFPDGSAYIQHASEQGLHNRVGPAVIKLSPDGESSAEIWQYGRLISQHPEPKLPAAGKPALGHLATHSLG